MWRKHSFCRGYRRGYEARLQSPDGPLALGDLIGLDVVLAIMDTLNRETGDPKYRAHTLLRKMVRGGLLGKKRGADSTHIGESPLE